MSVEPSPQSRRSSKRLYYIYLRKNRLGLFITVYDKEVYEGNRHFKNKSITKLAEESEVIKYLHEAVSIILYGDQAVNLGIRENFIHPDAVSTQYGVKVAIYISTHI